jgi:SH3-like domain-containing protein
MRLILLLLTCTFLTGCAGGSSSDPKLFQHIVSDRTGFFQQGPQQNTPPERYLDSGTRIHLMSRFDNFVQVELTDGETGWIDAGKVIDTPAN